MSKKREADRLKHSEGDKMTHVKKLKSDSMKFNC